MRRLTILMVLPLLLLVLTGCDKINPFDLATKDDLVATPTEPPPVVEPPACVAKIGTPLYLGELTVQLFDESDNCGSREWQFGDGETSEVPEPIHEYAECGAYIVKLVAWAVVDQPSLKEVRVEFECAVDL